MRPKKTPILLVILLGIGLISGLSLLPQEAQAWRGGGGGFHGGGGGGFGGFHGGVAWRRLRRR